MKPKFFIQDNSQTFIVCELDKEGRRSVREALLECLKNLEKELYNHKFEAKNQFDGVGVEVRLINVITERRI